MSISRVGVWCFSALLLFVASASPAFAHIVFTQANLTITNDATLPVDLNNDGNADIILQQSFRNQGCTSYYEAATPGSPGDGVLWGGSSPDGALAAALNPGAAIGPTRTFVSDGILADVYGGIDCPFPHNYGYWANAGPHYLGVVFVKNGKTRFGWIELNVSACGFQRCQHIETTLMGYAYQTLPGVAIPAGKT